MTLSPTLAPEFLDALRTRLHKANAEFTRRYPGESLRRQPVHTVYGGAQVFKSDTAPKMGVLARRSLEDFASTPADFGRAIGLPERLAPVIYARVLEKLEREPVEDYRIDFEDGYGVRPDLEEDGHALSTAIEVTMGLAAGVLPPSIGIRVKPFNDEMQARSIRTLDLFVTQLVTDGGRVPENFVVTLPKVTGPEQVSSLAEILGALEKSLALPEGTLRLEIMVETPQSIVNERGEIALLSLVEAGAGRCIAAHFGTYDYTASLNITAAHQHMAHPACDFARHAMQVALAGTGVWISDGATNIMPIPPHRAGERTLTGREFEENRRSVHGAWKLHADHVRHSLVNGYYQGWDLHPAQLPTRYGALYSFFLEGLEAA
ncbi:MAG TPA: phosphoenolpyruvate kinase, partial [Thermoanaerobaculia bacterium]|nr:phosphoenolpyruvate kinase [Thermoanaerobaculia bacterium]